MHSFLPAYLDNPTIEVKQRILWNIQTVRSNWIGSNQLFFKPADSELLRDWLSDARRYAERKRKHAQDAQKVAPTTPRSSDNQLVHGVKGSLGATEWLTIADAGNASAVCTKWKKIFWRQDVWKGIQHANFPYIMDGFPQTGILPSHDFKALAKSLSTTEPPTGQPPHIHATGNSEFLNSSLPLSNYFAVVQLYREISTLDNSLGKRHFVSWRLEFSESKPRVDTGIVLKGANPYATSPELTTFCQEQLQRHFNGVDVLNSFLFVVGDAIGIEPRYKNNVAIPINAIIRVSRRDTMRSALVFRRKEWLYPKRSASFDCQLFDHGDNVAFHPHSKAGWKLKHLLLERSITHLAKSVRTKM